MNLSEIQLMHDYHVWATNKILEQSAKLTDEQFETITSAGWGSFKGTLVHLVDAEYGWRVLLESITFADERLPDEFDSVAAVREWWVEESSAMRAYIDTLDDDKLNDALEYDLPDGTKRHRVIWHCLVHVINHGTQHRSELAAMLTEMGHSPGEIDFLDFVNSRK